MWELYKVLEPFPLRLESCGTSLLFLDFKLVMLIRLRIYKVKI